MLSCEADCLGACSRTRLADRRGEVVAKATALVVGERQHECHREKEQRTDAPIQRSVGSGCCHAETRG